MPEPSDSPESSRSVVTVKEVVAAVLAVLATVFVFENRRSTRIRFIGPEVNSPLWVALAVTLVVGFLAGWLAGRRRGR